MRNIVSTNAGSDVSEEYAEQVTALIGGARADRKTEQGQAFYVRLHSYSAPGTGADRWAVDYHDDASRELEEYDSEAEAESRYEEMVRDAAANVGVDLDGNLDRFDVTDVDGVPGPLPQLPGIGADDVNRLIDARSEEPVMYLERTEDGAGDELTLSIWPAALVSHHQVVLSRSEVLETLGESDGDGGVEEWFSSSDVTEENAFLLEMLVDTAKERRRGAADSLFLPSVDPR
ncbi:hypothetical protein PZ61_0237890 [Streptomyces sp. MNU77]|uniref:hypothetical protein n=1 Tax=Streptomyces sp. MNU77 TaxID=1573406 RepID=UPI0005E21742|nr:hypothetical protein [Streptomyces sp. MNU77]OLO25462.1 hypothetical protein PZ61_0237890 [Streptomyces sp. MNU77]